MEIGSFGSVKLKLGNVKLGRVNERCLLEAALPRRDCLVFRLVLCALLAWLSFCELRDWCSDCELRAEPDLRVLLEVALLDAVRPEAVLRLVLDLRAELVERLEALERATLLPRVLRVERLRDELFLLEDVRVEAAARASPKSSIRACPAMKFALPCICFIFTTFMPNGLVQSYHVSALFG